jgi:hypothetical protein
VVVVFYLMCSLQRLDLLLLLERLDVSRRPSLAITSRIASVGHPLSKATFA